MTATVTALGKKTGPLRNAFAQTTEDRDSILGISLAARNAMAAAVHAVLEQRAVGNTVTDTVHVWKWAMFETRTKPVLAPMVKFVSPLEIAKAITVARFSAIPQVAYIFMDVIQSAPLLSVFVEGEQYDDAVMDQLLDVESAIQDQFAASLHLTFSYVPYTLNRNPRPALRDSAQCIFERLHGLSH